MRTFALLRLGPALLLAVPAPAAEPPVLTRIAQVRCLSEEQARSGQPVHVRGVVTYRERGATTFYLQDATAGIYVENQDKTSPVRPGDEVEVRGVSSFQFAPNIGKPQIRMLGRGPWPAARKSTYDELATGTRAAQWVEITGVVQFAQINRKNQLDLRVASGPGRFSTVVNEFPAGTDPARLVDATVRLRGVCGTRFNGRRQFTGFQLRLPGMDQLTLLEGPPADPFAIAPTPIRDLLAFRTELVAPHRIRVQGVVTLSEAGRVLFLRDPAPLMVYTQQRDTLKPGDKVDVLGFPWMGEYAPVLRYAVFRKIGRAPAPEPVAADVAKALRGDYDAELVRLDGVVLDRIVQTGSGRLVIRQGNVIFNADLEEPPQRKQDALAHIPVSAHVLLTGVCLAQVDENRTPQAFRIRLRLPGDVVVVESPSWWTLKRVAWLAAGLAAAALGAFLWLSVLRRRVRKQTEIIRARLESEAALEQRFRDLFENANDLVQSRDLDGRITAWNAAAERVTGHRREEILGRHVLEIVAPEDRARIEELMNSANQGDASATYEVRILCKNGERRLLEYSPRLVVREGQPPRVDTIARDITERKKAELELQRAKEAAEAANQAKSEFLANMSHEIRTPMNGVIGMTALALQAEIDPEQREYLGTIRESAEALRKIIDDILDFSKIESGTLELDAVGFELRATLAESLASTWSRAREKGLAVRCEVAEDAPDSLAGDVARLRQVLLNLAGNAVKFTESGWISVIVGCEQRDETSCLLRFSVRDTGIGIPAEKQRSIFDAFVQADGSATRKFGGTGLGLAIASRLASLMGGRMWLESEPGGGSTFHFTVRFAVREPVAPAPESAPAAGRPATLSILLVEDNAVNQKVAARLLEKRGHRVALASNGVEALTQFELGRFDLILMDVQMPEMDGFEATTAIRERERATGRHTPIVALTAHAMKGDRERCLAAGMDSYVSKPVRPEELFSAIEELLLKSD